MLFDRHPSRSVWDVFGDMQRVLDAFGTTQPGQRWPLTGHDHPPVNLWANDERVAVEMAVPGVEPDAIELSIEGDVLTVSAKRETLLPETGRTLRQERGDFQFTRSVQLPFAVDAAGAEARVAKGVLVVALERQANDAPRRIAVTAG